MKKIIIFGATGGTGQQLVKQSLEMGHRVTAFVRNPEKLKLSDNSLNIFQGDVLNFENVSKAIKNQDVVLCSIGIPASDKSALRANGTANIIKAMENNGVKRLICQTSLGYGDSKEILPLYMKYIIVPIILKNAFKDHESQEAKIEQSSLDWIIVRPGNLTNGIKTGNYKYGFNYNDKIKLKVSRADVAMFMLSQIENLEYLRKKKVGISY
jgi:putative NADH-flavin reductase